MTEQALINEVKSLSRRLMRTALTPSERDRLESELARLEEALDTSAVRSRRSMARYHDAEMRI